MENLLAKFPRLMLMNRVRSWKHTLSFLTVMLLSSSQRRHIVTWLRSQREGYLLKAPSPWITFDAIDFLRLYLKPYMQVFEYGSGGSTLFWLHEGADCISIEHDPQWFSVIRQYIVGRQSVDYRLVPPEPLEFKEPSINRNVADPYSYLSSDANASGYTFRRYVTQIDEFSDDYFDIVMIDGRARPSCIMHSVRKVKPGGLIILDNADRSYYTERTHPFLRNFTRLEYPGAVPVNDLFSRTDIYTRIQ